MSPGGLERAVAAAEAAVRSAPQDPAAWAALARALFASRRAAPALAAWDRAIALAPRDGAWLSGKGSVLQALGRVEEAQGLHEAALAADPKLFEPAFSLARLAADAGDWAGASGRLAELRKRHADTAAIRWLAARIALGEGDAAKATRELRILLTDTRLGDEQRADALLLQGEAQEALDQPGEAFASAMAGKRLQRQLLAERAAGREAIADRFARLEAWVRTATPHAWPARAGEADGPARGHVFLFGFPRSGTTLLEQALAGHPDVATLEEAATLAEAQAAFLGDAAGLRRLSELSAAEATTWRGRYWAAVAARGVDPKGRVFVDKQPGATDWLPLVAALFPDAKVLFALRDPRDVVLSCLRHNFQLNALTFAFTDVAAAARAYAASMAMAQAMRERLGLAWLDVRHEDLVDDLEGGLGEVCGFLGLAPHPAMVDIAATAKRRSIRTPSAQQVRAGLNRRGLGRWRAYAKELAPALPILQPWIERFGYPAD